MIIFIGPSNNQRLASFLIGLRASSLLRDWPGSDLWIGYFFSFRCPLVNTPLLNTELLNCLLNYLFSIRVICYDRELVCQCLGIKHPSGAYDQIFIAVRQLRSCWCEALSLTRGGVCRLQLLLALASAVIFGSEFLETCVHISLAYSRLPFSSPPTTRRATVEVFYTASTRETQFTYD
jgi:hypothetical protein